MEEPEFIEKETIKEVQEYRNCKYKDYIRGKTVPDWCCPHCNNGHLELKNKEIRNIETEESKELHKSPDFEPEWITLLFTDFLICKKCNEVTAVVGEGTVTGFYDDEHQLSFEIGYMPKYFYPPLHLFSIPVRTPGTVSKSLIESFSLAWSDFASAANRLRVSIENLLESLDLGLTGKLHNKIEQLAKIPEKKALATKLMAIKWLGNDGSHYNTELEECDVAFAYIVFEEILNDLYRDKIDTMKLASMINSKKGSIADKIS